MNWESPLDPAPWSKEERKLFRISANAAYDRLVAELSLDYEIINDIENCIYEE